jgi:hypothetical protein
MHRRLSRADLIELVAAWCKYENEIAAKIIDSFCYASGDKWELWGHPLIKVDNNELSPLMALIRYSNIDRN